MAGSAMRCRKRKRWKPARMPARGPSKEIRRGMRELPVRRVPLMRQLMLPGMPGMRVRRRRCRDDVSLRE